MRVPNLTKKSVTKCYVLAPRKGRGKKRRARGEQREVYFVQNPIEIGTTQCVLKISHPAKVNQSPHSAGPYARSRLCVVAMGFRAQR